MTLTITLRDEVAHPLSLLTQQEREARIVEALKELDYAEKEADRWDAQIEADALAGKLDALAAGAHADYVAGHTFPAPSARNRHQNRTPEKVP